MRVDMRGEDNTVTSDPRTVPVIHQIGEPSEWVRRWIEYVPPATRVLDLACGSGRHARMLAAKGHEVLALDRDPRLIAGLANIARIDARLAELETGTWGLDGQRFHAIIVTNYLHRPLLPMLVDAVAPGGFLIYETFAVGNERFGRPSNPAFLLRPGELLEVVRGKLRVRAYEDLQVAHPAPAMVQRISAQREA